MTTFLIFIVDRRNTAYFSSSITKATYNTSVKTDFPPEKDLRVTKGAGPLIEDKSGRNKYFQTGKYHKEFKKFTYHKEFKFLFTRFQWTERSIRRLENSE